MAAREELAHQKRARRKRDGADKQEQEQAFHFLMRIAPHYFLLSKWFSSMSTRSKSICAAK